VFGGVFFRGSSERVIGDDLQKGSFEKRELLKGLTSF
jgi:hypothetical protein